MTLEEFAEYRKQLDDMCSGILKSKGRAYTRGSNDKLANFKQTAHDLGITTELAWAVYFHKHLDSIMHYVKNNEEGPEGITENIKDARNYLDLFYAILVEQGKVPVDPVVIDCSIHHGDFHPDRGSQLVWDAHQDMYIQEDEFERLYHNQPESEIDVEVYDPEDGFDPSEEDRYC